VIALLLAGVAAMTPIEAERAFAIDAQVHGQWTAFRKWAAPDALMFVPEPTKAQDFLKGRTDPPVSVMWWPAESYSSCDGGFAINTGPWVRGGGRSVGYFTTVWRRQGKDWRWIYDAGDALKESRGLAGQPKVRTAPCKGRPRGANVLGTIGLRGYHSGGGRSKDGTLVWSWTVTPKGGRHFLAQLWNGAAFDTVVEDKVAAE